MTRQCGDCNLCCKLLPMAASDKGERAAGLMVERGLMSPAVAANMTPEFFKPAGERCPHQQHHKGCTIYSRRPFACQMWSCRWLTGEDTADLRRPDRSHYVIDMMPDFVRVDLTGGTKADTTIGVVQIWLDPNYPDAYRDPALRAFMLRRAEREGMAALVRLSNSEAFFVAAPPLSADGKWFEHRKATREPEHTAEEKLAAIGPMKIVMEL